MAYNIEISNRFRGAPKSMSLQLLKEATNGFSEEQILGSGAYGVVYKGVLNGEEIAVKVIRGLDLRNGYDRDEFMTEFKNLWRLRHQNIVQLLGYCYETTSEYVDCKGTFVFADKIHIALCFEYMHNRSLREHLFDECSGHDWQTRYKIIKGICEGLKYLHEGLEKPMYHLDLKPENILLDKTMVPKIADFGLSRLIQGDQTNATVSPVGTSGYWPPEYIENHLISKKFDIFSLGVVMIRIITGYQGYYKKAEMSSSQDFIDFVYENWRNRLATSGCTTPEAQCNQVKGCIEIALGCVHADRLKRPTIGDIICRLDELGPTVDMPAGPSQEQQKSRDSSTTEALHAPVLDSLPVLDRLPRSCSAREPLDVVIVYAFDCTDYTPAWYTVTHGVFWMVQEKLTHFDDSCMGYIYFMLTGNTYVSDMKLVDSAETKATGYKQFAGRSISCTKNMASGLAEAHKMISNQGYQNGIIFFFSAGLINNGDFFDGTDNFISKVPVHTFTLGGVAYNQVCIKS